MMPQDLSDGEEDVIDHARCHGFGRDCLEDAGKSVD